MIQRCPTMFHLRLMCPLLWASRQRRSQSRWAQDRQCLTGAICTLHTESGGGDGSPKIWQLLRRQDESRGKHYLARLMRREGLQGIFAPKLWKRRGSGDQAAGITNQVAQNFIASGPNAKWVTDITFIPTQEGWF